MTPAEARQRAVEAAGKTYFCGSSWFKPERSRANGELLGRALAAYEAALWQPIETAPADGTRVLVYAPPSGGEYPASVQRVDMWRGGGWWQMRPAQPYTHWRPLPAGPGDAT